MVDYPSLVSVLRYLLLWSLFLVLYLMVFVKYIDSMACFTTLGPITVITFVSTSCVATDCSSQCVDCFQLLLLVLWHVVGLRCGFIGGDLSILQKYMNYNSIASMSILLPFRAVR